MRRKVVSITVGMCALNEEKNIARVLSDILSQKGNSWRLKEIFVYSDGSTDMTVQKTKSLKSNKIRIVESPMQRGKAYGINQIFQSASGDIVVMFDADVVLKNDEVIEQLIQPLVKEDTVMVVGGNSRPFAPKSFFEKAVYSTFQVFEDSRNKLKNGHNIFGCTGGCLALRTNFAKKLTLPKVIADDSYIYLSCVQKGYKFRYVKEAVVYYKLPKTLGDYLRQVFRSDPIAANMHLEKHFGKLSVVEHSRPLLFYIGAVWGAFVENPLGVVYMSLVHAVCLPLFPVIARRYKLSWHIAKSTK